MNPPGQIPLYLQKKNEKVKKNKWKIPKSTQTEEIKAKANHSTLENSGSVAGIYQAPPLPRATARGNGVTESSCSQTQIPAHGVQTLSF